MPLDPRQLAYAKLGAGLSGEQGLGSGIGAYQGLSSGTTLGELGGAANLAKMGVSNWGTAQNPMSLLGSTGLSSGTLKDINTGATGALDALAIQQGLKQGGIGGYGQALGAGLQEAGILGGASGLMSDATSAMLGTAGGYIMAPLAVYNAVKNWQSGNTGSDALQGAEAGAAIGSIVPGLGTLVGALIGGGVGALSSAFGGGRADPETGQFNAFAQAYNKLTPDQQAQMVSQNVINPQQAMTNLAGIMDAKNNTPGHSESIEQVFGRMGEQNMMNQMGQEINKAVASGQINPNMSIQDQWNKVVNPWLESKGVTWNPQQRTSKGTLETPAMQSSIQSLMGAYENQGWSPQTGTKFSGFQTPSTTDMNALTSKFYGNINPQQLASKTAAPTVQSMSYNPGQAQPTQPMFAQANPAGFSEGGFMKKRMSGLDHLERGAERYARKHFDDGGDTGDGGDSYSGPQPSDTSFQYTMPALTPADISAGGGGLSDTGAQSELANLTKDMPVPGDPSASSDTSGHTIKGDLQKVLQNLTGQGGLYGIFKTLGAAAPLAAMFLKPKTNLAKPQPAPGMTQGAGTPLPPIFNRTQNMQPSNLPGGAPMSQQDWYTYGSRPEAQFFQNNQMPMTQMTGVQPPPPTPGKARGGSALDTLGGNFGMPEFDSAVQHHAMGPGDGTSDNIPAQLSDGEYVMDANTVSLLGNGSNKAGAAKLDALRENLRRSAAKPMSKGKQFMKAKPPTAYMGRRK